MDYFGSPSIKSPPPDHAPLPMIPEGHHYQHRQHPQQKLPHPTILIMSPSCCSYRESLLPEASFHLKRKETRRGWVELMVQQWRKATTTKLTSQEQNGFSSICHAMYLLGNERAWKGLVDVQVRHHKPTKPQLTMLGPLHSQSKALNNNLASQVCERDKEG